MEIFIKKDIKSLSLLFIVLFAINAWADYNPFPNVKNARELTKLAHERHYQVIFRKRPARDIVSFDKVDNVHVSGRRVYAEWYYVFHMLNYIGKGIDDVQRDLRNSNIKLKIVWTPSPSITAYNTIYKQSISPGRRITGRQTIPIVQNKTQTKQGYGGFRREYLILGVSNIDTSPSWGHYETIGGKRVFVQGSDHRNSYTSHNSATPYDSEGNVLLTLYVYKYAGKVVKMPDLKGLTLIEAKAKLKKLKIPIGYIQDIYEKTTNPALYGKIFEQTIKAGTPILKPKMMGVKIYSMPKIKMPDLTNGWTVSKVASQIKYLSLVPQYTVTYDKTQDGVIFNQSVKPGTTLTKKTLLTVKAYKYENPYYRADYIHLDKEKAIALAQKRHLKYEIEIRDVFEYFHTTTIGEDFIKNNNNKVADVQIRDKKIVFIITKYTQKETKMPTLVGKDCQDGIKELRVLQRMLPGLKYKVQYIPTQKLSEWNKVIKTTPEVDSKIISFDEVKIYCGMYKGDVSAAKERVPDLKGKTQDEAIALLKKLGFKKIKIVKIKEPGAKQGTVVNITGDIQLPIIGLSIFKNDTIKLFIADVNAVEMFLMPNVVGLSMEDAKQVLIKGGFKNIKFTDEKTEFVKYATTLPAGSVIKSYPSYKAITTLDGTKELIIRLKNGEKLLENINLPSSDKNNDMVLVPAVKNTLDETIQEMKNKGLIPSIKEVSPKNPSLKGTIDPNTIPSYNTIVKKNTQIYITHYLSSITVPNVCIYWEDNIFTGNAYRKHYTVDQARKRLENLGLKVKISYQKTDNKNLNNLVSSQTPKSGSKVDIGAEIELLVYQYNNPTVIKPTLNNSIKLSAPSQDYARIQDFYKSFKEAYESKDEGQVVRLLSDDWESSNGGDISDLEDNLNRVFSVFDEINYNISNLNIQSLGNSKYRVSYNVDIVGEIYDDDITHEEKSSVIETVIIKNGKPLILKTIGGQYWSIK